MRDLNAEYLADAPELRPFYVAPPRDLLDRPPARAKWTKGLREALRVRTGKIRGGSLPEIPSEGVAIVTGQQAGLFLGPLYTVYKAATAVILARRIHEIHGVPCVPVFWLGSDDHDFEEVRAAHVLNKDHEPLSLRYEPQADVAGLPMFEVPLEDSLHGLVDRLVAETPGSEFRAGLAQELHDTLSDSRSLAEWCARLLGRLFRDTPLVHFAPHWLEMRRMAVPILEREISHPLRSTELLNEAGTRLQALGFEQQVVKAPDECNFFLFVDKRRRKVLYRDGLFILPEEGLRYSHDELIEMLRDDPTRFSPNVALRCVVQQKLFGAAAYVGGPGEVAYWAQLKGVFEHFGVPMPIVYPRANCVLTTLKLNKLMDKFGFSLPDLFEPQDALLDRALRRTVRSKTRDGFDGLRAPVEAALAVLASELEGGPTVRAMTESLRERVGEDLKRIERTLLQADRVQVESVERQVARLCNSLAPMRRPQERVYSVYSFLFEQGDSLIQRLVDELDVESFRMNEVVL